MKLIRETTEVILRRAGYSTGTFGEDMMVQRTATEVSSQNQRSKQTKARKLRILQPKLDAHIKKMLMVAQALFHDDVDPETVRVLFKEAPITSQLENAQAIQYLDTAGAISVEQKVRTAHPEWEDDEVELEVAAIKDEAPSAVIPTRTNPNAPAAAPAANSQQTGPVVAAAENGKGTIGGVPAAAGTP